MNKSLESDYQLYLTAIEEEIQRAIHLSNSTEVNFLTMMLNYHMGWVKDLPNASAKGKRIRPLLVLLTCSAAGGNWKDALPAAAAVELIHNFSLIHDDIEDRSPLRRGRATVWKKWGIPQAINAGDAMFTLAHLQLFRLDETISKTKVLRAAKVLQEACLQLTHGQYLDLAFERRDDVTIEEYWKMVEGKTAALISASTELGSICAPCDDQVCVQFRNFGKLFGFAFQVQDDLLGIWGDSSKTGKSNQSDLITGKKTLPILYGLANASSFAQRWQKGTIQASDVKDVMEILESEGGKAYSYGKANELIETAIDILDSMHHESDSVKMLKNLTMDLVHRQA